MKIRLTGTQAECFDFIYDLEKHFNLRSISDFYPNTKRTHFKNKEGRIYCETGSSHRKDPVE